MWDSSPVGFWVNTKAFSYAWLQFTFSTSWLFPSRRWLHFLCYTVLLFKLHSEEGRALHKKCKKVVHHWRKKCCNGIKSTLEFFEFKNCCEGIWSMYSICTQGCTMYSDRVPTTSLPKKYLQNVRLQKFCSDTLSHTSKKWPFTLLSPLKIQALCIRWGPPQSCKGEKVLFFVQ